MYTSRSRWDVLNSGSDLAFRNLLESLKIEEEIQTKKNEDAKKDK